MQDVCKVVGIKEYDKGGGKIGSILHLLKPFTTYDVTNSLRCVGDMGITEFTTDIDTSSLKVGDSVELLYSKGFKDQAFLKGINLVK